MLNTLIKLVAISLTLASAVEVEATRDTKRRKLALLAPAGIVWVVFVASMAFPLGPIGNIVVVGASALAILRLLKNAIALGVFRAASGSETAVMR
jgi:hypothetical protein